VFRQIMRVHDEVGGFGHLIFIGRSGLSGFFDHR
jgi:hypothetical protein